MAFCTYTLIDPVTGEQRTLPEIDLTRNLRINCILLREDEHLGIITHRDLVVFARWCAGVTLARLRGEPPQSVVNALCLVDRWLDDVRSVSSEELSTAADAARAAAREAAVAAWSAWAAAREAAVAAARAARAAADAAGAAGFARAAGAAAASYETQERWLVEHLQSGK